MRASPHRAQTAESLCNVRCCGGPRCGDREVDGALIASNIGVEVAPLAPRAVIGAALAERDPVGSHAWGRTAVAWGIGGGRLVGGRPGGGFAVVRGCVSRRVRYFGTYRPEFR